MCNSFKVVTFLIAYACVASADPVSFITKCRAEDSKCLKGSIQSAIPVLAGGVPELDVDKMDPLFFKNMDASIKDLSLILNDINITGLKNCIAKKSTRDVSKSKLLAKVQCDNVKIDGQYDMGGRLLVLPFEGKGKLHANIKKVIFDFDVDLAEKVKDGKKYWDIKSWKHTYELKDKSEIELENLFQGNEVLGRAARELVKQSPNEIIGEVAPPILKAILTKVAKNVNNFFHKVPIDDLALN